MHEEAYDEKAIENGHLTATKLREILEKQTGTMQNLVVKKIESILKELPTFSAATVSSSEEDDNHGDYPVGSALQHSESSFQR